MICIAAFIILLVIWLFTPALRLFGFKKQADTISRLFKKATYCFTRRATFRACDSNFKDEIKDSVLSKLIVRHKNWVKPVSIGIEISAFLIILVTIWSLLTVAKAGLALYVYGTCDVRTPDACALSSAEACSIDSVGSGNPVVDWFDEWGEVFGALPARLTNWKAEDFVPEGATYFGQDTGSVQPTEVAIDLFDPGCIICRRSYQAQKDSGFFNKYKTYVIPYVIRGEDGDKFTNSELLARYLEAVRGIDSEKGVGAEWVIIDNLFAKKDENGDYYQDAFNGTAGRAYPEEKAVETIHAWLEEAGYSKDEIKQISVDADSEFVQEKLIHNRDIIENQIKTKRIPTMIFDSKKHEGLYKTPK